MSQVLDELVALLSLETIEENLFRGASQDLGFPQLFGGQVLGQALSAACQTVMADRHVHSLHGYFLRAGDALLPVVYQVERVRDGGSFSTRRVTAIQKGQPIFFCSASFQADEPGFEHQPSMPEGIEAPENLPSEMDLFSPHAERIPQPMRDKIFCAKPIQIRPVNPGDPFRPKPSEPLNMYWFKADGSLSANPALHKYLLAYASDFGLLTASLRPHGASFWQPDMQVASLDHALWFHRDLKMDDWHLYVQESPWSGGARGFSRGSIFNRAGELVASVAQEGLIRRRESRA
ncbi:MULTISPECIES: acyl-CoA thioesterase [Pseudomonas]|uniref:Acyl-CoA thioesterase 2 n=1 Tax=Pseudomonas flexibilis TaxID=706570 RepID=A0A0B3C3J0_9PSED|nr:MULTISPECIES: acyl-CoA thioesterase II [Pseudomonas]KHO66072.1 palmitoyl-CoA hydrolase [Pseudomonas flexibilis]SCY52037.1 acyl-CoA thioesterase-2 [Pseudomonas flexibilis]